MFILVVYVCSVISNPPPDCGWLTLTPRPLERDKCEGMQKRIATREFIIKAECRDPSDAP
jgi:hypothetical protein